MPELPEVETIARELRRGHAVRGPRVVGRVFAGVTFLWARQVAVPSPEEFRRRLRGQAVRDVGRRGKFLLFRLTRDVLAIHLKMSGDLQVIDREAPVDPHVRAVFRFRDGGRLLFRDARKFGRLYLVRSADEITGGLGPEPLESRFTPAALASRLAERRRPLKVLLLDQAFLAGLGNIYANEALHRAKLHPLRRSDSLARPEARALWRGLRRALRDGIRHNGASLDWVYRGGRFQDFFRVYARAGRPCLDCGALIERIVVGQRASFFCPRCQTVGTDLKDSAANGRSCRADP